MTKKSTKKENEIIAQALQILEGRIVKAESFITKPEDAVNFIKLKIATLEHEVFTVIFLNSQNGVIEYSEMFRGTINGASVHPREVVKQALSVNAASVLFAHNHPSTFAQPSQADRHITTKLVDALALVDIKVLDHFVVGGVEHFSFSENGWL